VRIEGVDPKKTSFPMRYVFRKIRKMLGRDLTPQKIQARVPRVFWVNVLMERLLGQKAQVPQRLRSILLLRTASRVGCPFWIDANSAGGRVYGLTDEEIVAIRGGSLDGFAAPEQALLRMADAMAETPSNISDELYAELRRHFSEEQLIELAASAAQENYRARYNRVFDVQSDGLYRKGLRFKEKRDA
jgi:alkylhydroperoxidase family enzyme